MNNKFYLSKSLFKASLMGQGIIFISRSEKLNISFRKKKGRKRVIKFADLNIDKDVKLFQQDQIKADCNLDIQIRNTKLIISSKDKKNLLVAASKSFENIEQVEIELYENCFNKRRLLCLKKSVEEHYAIKNSKVIFNTNIKRLKILWIFLQYYFIRIDSSKIKMKETKVKWGKQRRTKNK